MGSGFGGNVREKESLPFPDEWWTAAESIHCPCTGETTETFQDFSLSFPYGFTQEDIEAVEALDDVSLAQGAYFAYGTTWADGERFVLAVQSWTENIDRATIVEGVMPSASNKIAVEQIFADRSGLKVVDTMNIEEGSTDGKINKGGWILLPQ